LKISFVRGIGESMAPKVIIVTREELQRKIKTKMVLIDTGVVSRLFEFFVSRGNIEGTALLRGRIIGEYLVIKDAYCCRNSEGTSTSAVTDAGCFAEASKIKDGNYIVGSAHSHVGGIPVFMSTPDRKTQRDFQAIFSDAVSMVMNPFTPDGICFKFYRFENGTLKQLRYGYLRDGNEDRVQA